MRASTTNFYAPPSAFNGGTVVFTADEASHARKVLRAREGDQVQVVDGIGGWYLVRLDHVGKTLVGTVMAQQSAVGEPVCQPTIGIGTLKQASRFETFLEKAVELGVHKVVPLSTARTERVQVKPERWRRICIAAMKQCGRSVLPQVSPVMDFAAFLNADDAPLKCIAHEQAAASASLPHLLQHTRRPDRCSVLIGPEGGFTDQEVEAAVGAGYHAVSLGPRRLRAETAGMVAAALVATAFDNNQQIWNSRK